MHVRSWLIKQLVGEKMTRISIMMICAALLSGMTAPNHQFSLVGDVVVEGRDTILELTYSNTSRVAHCILADDFSEHPMRPALRMTDKDNNNVPYAGPLPIKESSQSSAAFYIVPPGKSISTKFEITGNYDIRPGRSYEIRYSLPVTKCNAVNNGLEEIPSAYWPFMVDPAFSFDDWTSRLKTVSETFSEWARSGFFVELQHVTFNVESSE